jgi:hypothetical protein
MPHKILNEKVKLCNIKTFKQKKAKYEAPIPKTGKIPEAKSFL